MKIVKLSELLKKYGSLRKVFASKTMRSLGFILITPAEAKLLLKKAARNRIVAGVRVHEILRAMYEDKWIMDEFGLIGPPVAFNVKGELANGNTRMQALTLLNKPMAFHIVVGVPQHMINMMDEAQRRMEKDRIHAFNAEPVVQEITKDVGYRSAQLSAVIKALYVTLVQEKRPTMEDITRICTHYKAALVWVLKNCGGVFDPAFRRTNFMAAAVMVYQWAKEHGQLEQFKSVTLGVIKGADISGTTLLLRNYLMALRTRVGTKSKVTDSQWIVQMKCLRAYQAIFVDEPALQSLDHGWRSADLCAWFFGRTAAHQAKKLGVRSTRDVLRELRSRISGKKVLHLVKAMEVAA